MIGVINYGLGNLRAFANLYQRLHIPTLIANTVEDINKCSKLILPGVGHFDYAINKFRDSKMYDSIENKVLNQGTPILGICIGMHMLAHKSEEGSELGLGWIDGEVKSFDGKALSQQGLPMPHMGWNDIDVDQKSPLFKGFEEIGSRFYFLHSYYFQCYEKDKSCISVVNYGEKICCSVNKNNIYGVQFHPEKSHHFGESLLRNFYYNT